MNEVLCNTSKSGTASKLKSIAYDVATKTGTCGNTTGNTDAYAVSYTSQHCIGVWLGDRNNERLNVSGGNQCCEIVKRILDNLYSQKTPLPLDKNTDTTEIEIDLEEYERNDKILIAEQYSPKTNRLKVKCLNGNVPTGVSTRFSSPTIKTPQIIVNKDNISIQLCLTKYYSYIVNRIHDGKKVEIFNGKWQECVKDTPPDGKYVYEVIPYYDDGKIIHYGTPVLLPQVSFNTKNSDYKVPDIAYKDWFKQ